MVAPAKRSPATTGIAGRSHLPGGPPWEVVVMTQIGPVLDLPVIAVKAVSAEAVGIGHVTVLVDHAAENAPVATKFCLQMTLVVQCYPYDEILCKLLGLCHPG